MYFRTFGILLLSVCLSVCAKGQDTLIINLEQATAIMLNQNLQIIASHYDLKISEANLFQARAWNNPYFNWNQDLYSIEKNQYLNYRNQFLVQIDQVFSIAGKYTRTVNLAKLEHESNRLIVRDIVRALLHDVSIQFQKLLLFQSKSRMYNEILNNFDFVIQSAERQYKLGAISKKELIRLESERQTIRNETSINRIELQTIESSIKVLLNLRPEIKLIAIEESVPIGELPDLMSLYELSQKNRPDFQLSKNRIDIGTAEVKLQKAKSVPDITFSYQPKDRGSNYVRPYSGIEIGFELPLFHRNRGNIMSAEASRMRYTVESELKSNQLQNEVHASVINFMENRNNYNRFTPKYLEEVLQMNISAESNYIKRNINLLEYIDIKRIYIENYLQYLESKTRLLESASQINFVIGTQIFK